jgi:rhodanese-related sulfurtransferase
MTDAEATTGTSPEQLAELLESGEAEVIDVRTDAERAAGHIAGTRHVPFERLFAEAGDLDRARPIVFYCRSGERSAAAAQALTASGWTVATSLEGGLVAWVEHGLPLEPADGQVVEPSGLPPA